MSRDTWLLPNLGAEADRSAGAAPAVAAMAQLWRLLFPDDSRVLGEVADDSAAWPDVLGPLPHLPAFDWLAGGGVTAWLNTPDAARAAADAGQPLLGPAPEIVRRVHDKAFALAASEQAELVPPCLAGLALVLEPDELTHADVAAARIQKRVDAWPAWIGGQFTLKPRIGSSGRGRVPGRDGRADTPEIRHSLPRLAKRGGAILEPWLRRERDLSVQLHVAPDGTLTLIATLEQELSASGVYRGHRGELDHRARVVSGTRHDDALLEAAVAVASRAHAEGFSGACGIDAFTFEGPRGVELRPVVELNARFTTGTVIAGVLRRAAPRIAETLGRVPGERRAFHFEFDAQRRAAPSANSTRLVLPLAASDAALQPTLVVARDRDGLDAPATSAPRPGTP